MTPLAHRIAKELTLPVKRRTFQDKSRLLPLMGGAHCFECTAILEMADELDDDIARVGTDGELAFLPADRTWLEWVDAYGTRCGVLLEQDGDGAIVRRVRADPFATVGAVYRLPLRGVSSGQEMRTVMLDAVGAEAYLWPPLIYAILAIVNTPRLIGRKQHMPHRGLERALIKAKPLVGSFPLHAWTELTLSVSAMMTEADGPEHEAHLTGERCLHFCRAHLRVWQGKLVQVKAHWRGNPALGIKRTRYKIAA